MNHPYYVLLFILMLSTGSCQPPAPFVTPASGRIESKLSGASSQTSQASAQSTSNPTKTSSSPSSTTTNRNASKDSTVEFNAKPAAKEQRPDSQVTDSSPPDIQGDIEAIGLTNYPNDKGFEVDKEFWLDLQAPKSVEFSPELSNEKDRINGFVSVERKDEDLRFKIRFPSQGEYSLVIWAKDKTEPTFQSFVAYKIKANEGTNQKEQNGE